MNQESKRAESVEKIMRLAFDSLESHLKYARVKTSEGTKFHKDAIKQYLDIMVEAHKLY